MQPWVRQTDSRLDTAESNIANLTYQLANTRVPDKAVYTSGPAASYPSGTTAYAIQATSTVQFVNTTGLIEVTITATMAATTYGSIGAGFYLDGALPVILNYAPQFGVQFIDPTGTAGGSGSGMSYTIAIPVRPGLHTAGIFYSPNNTGTGTSQIVSSSILVKGL